MDEEQDNPGKHEGGRPTKYKEEFDEQAYKLCLLGATDADLADFFDVAESTLNLWKQSHPEFSESIKKGKTIADANVADRLYQRAMGYQHEDTHFATYEGVVIKTPTVKHYPPDTTAAIFWLKNRQKNKWVDKTVRDDNVSIKERPSWLDAAAPTSDD